jgi:hypothetical protein
VENLSQYSVGCKAKPRIPTDWSAQLGYRKPAAPLITYRSGVSSRYSQTLSMMGMALTPLKDAFLVPKQRRLERMCRMERSLQSAAQRCVLTLALIRLGHAADTCLFGVESGKARPSIGLLLRNGLS